MAPPPALLEHALHAADEGNAPQVQALRALGEHFAQSRQLPALVMAWQAAARVPEFMHAFRIVAQGHDARQAIDDLAKRCSAGELTPQGVLLGIHVLEAVGHEAFAHPRVQQLLTSNYVVRNEHRLRRFLVALRGLVDQMRTETGNSVQRILTWPSDANLRGWLQQRGQTNIAHHRAVWAQWLDGATPRSDLRAALTDLTSTVKLVGQHAQHAHASQQRVLMHDYGNTLAQMRKELLEALHTMQPPKDVSPADQAHFARCLADVERDEGAQTLAAWAKQAARAPGPGGEWAHHVRAITQSWMDLGRCAQLLRKTLHKPMPHRDFLDTAHAPKNVQTLYSKHLLAAHIDGLEALLTVMALGGNTRFNAPQDLVGRALGALELDASQQATLPDLLKTFRRQHLFWKFAARMRQYDPALHGQAFSKMLAACLQGPASYHATRRETPQMRALFAEGERQALLHAWEAGANAPLPDSALAHFPEGSRLVDTGSFADFASSGDEISGSCHSLYGGSYFQYLMGRVVCGSKRMVTIQDADGRLQARAMLRLMRGPQGEPVLLLSDTYVHDAATDAAAQTLLKDFAKQRAAALGLPLASCFYGDLASGRHSQGQPVQVHHLSGDFQEYWDETLGAGRDAFKAWLL